MTDRKKSLEEPTDASTEPAAPRWFKEKPEASAQWTGFKAGLATLASCAALLVGLVLYREGFAQMSDTTRGAFRAPDAGMALGIFFVAGAPFIVLGVALSFFPNAPRSIRAMNAFALGGVLFLLAQDIPGPRWGPIEERATPPFACGELYGDRIDWAFEVQVNVEARTLEGIIFSQNSDVMREVDPSRCTGTDRITCELDGRMYLWLEGANYGMTPADLRTSSSARLGLNIESAYEGGTYEPLSAACDPDSTRAARERVHALNAPRYLLNELYLGVRRIFSGS